VRKLSLSTGGNSLLGLGELLSGCQFILAVPVLFSVVPGYFSRQIRMVGREKYRVRLSLAGRCRIGLNIVRRGKIGVKGLFLEYGEYSSEYSPTPSLKPLS